MDAVSARLAGQSAGASRHGQATGLTVPRSLFPLVIGWIGLFAVCAIVPDRAFSAPDPLEAPAVYSSGRVLHVGPARRLKTPSEAAIVAQRGDAIRIDAGNYFDCAAWRTPDITLIGEGPGYAHIQDISCDGKALWVFYDGPVRIENIRFSGAKVARRNGAGIRWEGRGWLVVDRSKFDRNEMAILTHNKRVSSLSVSQSVFDDNGYCATYCGHGIYAGLISTLIVRNSQFRKTHFGHHIKSRALTSHITGNRLSDGETGTSSYAINLPNSGTATIRGNTIQKGPLSDNVYCAICIGEEITALGAPAKRAGARNPSEGILIDGNSFQNDSGRQETVFVWNRGSDPVSLGRNTLKGPGAEYFLGRRPELDRNE
jgi:hypothetical protein